MLSCLRALFAIVGIAALTAGCEVNAAAVDDLYRHTEAITGLVERHKADPRAAIAAIEAYEDKHRAEIADLERRARKIRADLGQRSKRKLRARWNEHAPPLRKRLETLTEGALE